VNALERPADFYQKWFNCKNFDEMKVPQHIELAGYDKIHYINTMYPWEGHIYRRPAGYGKCSYRSSYKIFCFLWNE
jgi:beta-galactosidase